MKSEAGLAENTVQPGQKLQVMEQIDQLHNAETWLEDAIADLGIRLSVVLTDQEAPSECESKKEDSPPLVHLADELRQIKNGINLQVSILRGYLKRLQLP